MYNMATINSLVKDYRSELGLTQRELANMAGVSRQSIISIERGRFVPSLPLALKLAKILGCKTDTLFQLKEED